MITPLDGSRNRSAVGTQPGPGHRSLLGIGGGQHDTDPVPQPVQVQPGRGVVLAQHHHQPLAVGVPEQPAPPAGAPPPGSLMPTA